MMIEQLEQERQTVAASMDELTFQRALEQMKRVEERGSRDTLQRLRIAMLQGTQFADFDHSRGTTTSAAQLIEYLIAVGLGTDLEVVAACLAGYYQRRNWWLAQQE